MTVQSTTLQKGKGGEQAARQSPPSASALSKMSPEVKNCTTCKASLYEYYTLYNLTYFVDNIIFQYSMLAALAALYLPLVVVSHVHDSMSQGKKPLDNLEKCGKLLDNQTKFFA